jgi:outer membrane immunogenic protein
MSMRFLITRPPACRSVLAVSLFLATALLACGPIARAADLPAKAAPASAAPPYQWSGCYAGLNGGGGAIGTNFNTTVGPGTYLAAADAAEVTNDGTGSHDNTSFVGGGQAGCNWQSGTLVAGVEADFDYFRGKSSFYNSTDTLPVAGVPFVIGQETTTNYLATLRPRFGVAADRNFAYLTGGVAFTTVSYTETYVDGNAPPGVGSATASKFVAGWTAGAGWEYAMTDHWLFRAEYLFAGFPKTSATGVIAVPGASNPLHGSSDLTLQVARAGVEFKF